MVKLPKWLSQSVIWDYKTEFIIYIYYVSGLDLYHLSEWRSSDKSMYL